MKKFFLVFTLLITTLQAKIDIAVSITPEYQLIKAITKDKANIHIMIPKGASPHTFEPKPKQMITLSKSDIYFAIGVEFDKIWLKKFKRQNPNLKIVDLSKNIKKTNNNPHIWLNTDNLLEMAKIVANTLSNIDEKNKKFYLNNLKEYETKLQKCKKRLLKIVKNKKQKKFLTFHPAFLYMAKEFNLKQISIEIDGKEPTLKQLLNIIKLAKKEKLQTIITSPEFSDKSAKVIAKELNATVIKISPLDEKICNTLEKIINSLK